MFHQKLVKCKHLSALKHHAVTGGKAPFILIFLSLRRWVSNFRRSEREAHFSPFWCWRVDMALHVMCDSAEPRWIFKVSVRDVFLSTVHTASHYRCRPQCGATEQYPHYSLAGGFLGRCGAIFARRLMTDSCKQVLAWVCRTNEPHALLLVIVFFISEM